MTRTFSRRLILTTLAAALLAPLAASAAELPKVIRFGSPLVGTGNRPVGSGNAYSNAQIKGLFEQEFKKDGIKVEWNNFRGAGPSLNESVANGLLDIFWEGDLPAIVGRSGGLKTKLILADGRRSSWGIAVPADSSARSIEELKGKKIAVFKGTAVQLGFGKFLSARGLSERDFKTINMDTNAALAALTTKDVDAVFTSPSALYALEDRGVAKVVYTSRKDAHSATLSGQGYILVTEEFEKKYPEVVQRVVNVLVKESAWASEEKNRTALFQLWAKSGTPFTSFKRDQEGLNLSESLSPLLDEEFIGAVRHNVAESQKLKLLRGNLDVASWVDGKYLAAALKAQGLEKHWTPLDASGKPKK